MKQAYTVTGAENYGDGDIIFKHFEAKDDYQAIKIVECLLGEQDIVGIFITQGHSVSVNKNIQPDSCDKFVEEVKTSMNFSLENSGYKPDAENWYLKRYNLLKSYIDWIEETNQTT